MTQLPATAKLQLGSATRSFLQAEYWGRKVQTIAPDEMVITSQIGSLLFSAFVLKESAPASNDAIENLKSMHVTFVLTNDLILGLCRLMDENSRTIGIRRYKNSRSRASSDHTVVRVKRRRLADFMKKALKHRNCYLAHLSADDRSNLPPLTELYQALKDVVDIWDALMGERVSYSVCEIDLRSAVLG